MAISFDGETKSNAMRESVAAREPISLRTYTPSQLVIERSAGLYHYTPDGRRLADFTSGVLVANLGHNPKRWWQRLAHYMRRPDPRRRGPLFRLVRHALRRRRAPQKATAGG